MWLDPAHPRNQLVIEHLRARSVERGEYDAPLIALPKSHPNPYWEAGCHPEIVDLLWGPLNAALPTDGRALVCGTPALVHPGAGVVLALGYGTAYVLRLPLDVLPRALSRGWRVERQWTAEHRTHVEEALGAGWVFGRYTASEERAWLRRTYDETTAA